MKREISKKNRRIVVIINYLSIFFILVFFYAGINIGWNVLIIAGEIIVIITAVMSFIYLHIRTHLWKLVHTSIEELDERQIQVRYESLRYSYSIFSIISLLVIFYHSLTIRGDVSFGMLILSSLIYLAHTLPSSIIAWTEKKI